MNTKRGALARLRHSFDAEMAEYARAFFPDPARETEAQRDEHERVQAERTAEALAQRDTRDALLAGSYGKEAQAKAREFVISFGKDSTETLRRCSEVAGKVRKSEYYRRLNVEKRKREVD